MNSSQIYRAQRHQVVYISLPVPPWHDDPLPARSSAGGLHAVRTKLSLVTGRHLPTLVRLVRSRRLAVVARREPFGPCAATVSRPFGDAMVALQVLRTS